jgi:hypothetical protein
MIDFDSKLWMSKLSLEKFMGGHDIQVFISSHLEKLLVKSITRVLNSNASGLEVASEELKNAANKEIDDDCPCACFSCGVTINCIGVWITLGNILGALLDLVGSIEL